MKKKIVGALSGLLISSAVMAATETYQIDNKHSFANFNIRHIVAKTTGSFTDVTGVIKIDAEHLEKSSVQAKIGVASVNTGLAKRDEHIQKSDYLDALNFGEITFVSKSVKALSATEGAMTGDFMMHGVTKTISMPFKVLGFGADPWGGQRAGFEATTKIKASDYGFGWMKEANAPVGDDIEVTLFIEAIKAK
ncbi:MAG: YceI family protein [Betaproteobacteria bacterium]|nr:YceI family protein [Betaproteobacteria bacterium]MCH9848517.1 YceI family protein [Betaproteobacteria bacterium]